MCSIAKSYDCYYPTHGIPAMNKTPLDLIKEVIKDHPNTFVRNAKLETKEDLGQDYLLHITTDKFKELVPIVSRRAAPDEANDILRAHVSANLIDCIQGYGRLFEHVIDAQPSLDRDEETGVLYKGGMYILRADFEVCMKPGKRLVESSAITDERWLIGYPGTSTYPVECIGRIIPLEMTVVPSAKLGICKKLTLVVEVTDKRGVMLSNKESLGKGYHQLVLIEDPAAKKLQIKLNFEIGKEEFEKEVKFRTVALSYKEPIYAGW